MSEEAFIYEAIRTPRGKGRNGALTEVKPINLVTGLIDEMRVRHPNLDENMISDMVLGCVSPVGDQGADIARTAVIASGMPDTVGGVQLNRFCASGLEAVNTAAQKVRSGWDDLVYADNGQIQKWLRSWRVIPSGQNNLRRTAQHSLQLDCETGVGLNGIDPNDDVEWFFYTSSGDQLVTNTGDLLLFSPPTVEGADPEVMLRWSDDGGHTWSNEHWASMGRIGQYGRRVFWRRLGMTMKLRDRVYEVSGTDPVKIAIVGAELLLSPTRA
jgi:hypothetical protein